MTESLASKQIKVLIKKLLKQHGYTYADMAQVLGLTEPSIKRIMSSEEFSVKRLEVLSHWFGMNFFDFLEKARIAKPSPHAFSQEQEDYFLNNPQSMYVMLLLSAGFSVSEVQEKIPLKSADFEKTLIGLKEVGVIDSWAENRVNITHNGPFSLKKDGQLREALRPLLIQQCVRILEQRRNIDYLLVGELYMTESLRSQMQAEYEELYQKYSRLAGLEQDIVDSDEKFPVTTLNFQAGFNLWKAVLLDEGKEKGPISTDEPFDGEQVEVF